MSVGHGVDSGFLAVKLSQPAGDLVINPVVGAVTFHQAHSYFPSQRDYTYTP